MSRDDAISFVIAGLIVAGVAGLILAASTGAWWAGKNHLDGAIGAFLGVGIYAVPYGLALAGIGFHGLRNAGRGER